MSSPNTPATAAIEGVSFRLSFIPLRLRGYAYRCMFCGRNARTTTEAGRREAMERHAVKCNVASLYPRSVA